MKVQPVSLNGKVVCLEPLTENHVPDLTLVGKDASIWRYLPYGDITSEERMRWLIWLWLKWAARGTDLPFAVIYQETG